MIEKAYAKINIGLNVLDKRDDGYHNLETIMVPLELHDSLDVTLLPSNAHDDYITCDEYSLKIAQYNLCHKAINLCREKWGFTNKFRIEIHKNIYLQAGLGGGSADGAATIRAIVKLLKINTTDEEIKELAIKLGSDVPFAYFNKPALVTKKGEELSFFEHHRNDFILLVKPKAGLSTKEVFEKSDTLNHTYCDLNEIKELFINDDPMLYEKCSNGLVPASYALLPELSELETALKDEGFDFVIMTGSGSTMACFTKNKKLAYKVEAKYDKLGYQVETTTFHFDKPKKECLLKKLFKKHK